MTTDLITALQTHGELHKGTDLGGVLQWAFSSQKEITMKEIDSPDYRAGY